MRAVVTDARLRVAVSIIRSLGEAGVSVVAAEASGTRNVLGYYSKFTSYRLRLSHSARTAPSAADLKALLEAAGEDGVVVPTFTSMVELLSRHAEEASTDGTRAERAHPGRTGTGGTLAERTYIERTLAKASHVQRTRFKETRNQNLLQAREGDDIPSLPGASGPRFLVPPLSSFRISHDKAQCFRLAKSLGVPVPETRFPRDEEASLDYAADDGKDTKWAERLPYPVIIKYRSGEDLGLPAAQRYCIARSPVEALQKYGEMDAIQESPLVQEYVEGEDWGAALLYDWQSRLVAAFTYKSIRERPKGAGPTVYAVSESCPELVEYSHRVLSALRWRGVAMLDFRKGRDGKFRLLEINPRFWGSIALSILAGVDFPMLYYRCCLGEDIASRSHGTWPLFQEDGVKVRFFPQDFLSLAQYAKHAGNTALRSMGYVAREGFKLLNPGLKDGLLSLSDPLPGLAYLVGGAFSRHGRT
ncbi:MAG: ATP-grasp domain-containing protein [Bacillota bacterium]